MTNEEAIRAILFAKRDVLADSDIDKAFDMAIEALRKQIPMKVETDIDRSWGIYKTVPACPSCGSFLQIVDFIGDGKKISYCDSCGQAVNWEEWKYDD